MIIVTGALGFIGSCFISKLNKENFKDIVAVDDFTNETKFKNLEGKEILYKIHRNKFHNWLDKNQRNIQFVFHIGARTDTAEFDYKILNQLNLNYTKKLWNQCIDYAIPFVYASSAATYGLGEFGYDDNHETIPKLKPLNPYGESKNDFDKWALKQEIKPMFWTGLKFFNVYGPNEYHKGRMSSVILHTYRQILENGAMKLFQSHNPNFKDGQQMRDFVYVKDVLEVLYFLLHNRKNSGIYNLGSGKARSFLDLAKATFHEMDIKPNVLFIPTPIDIRDKYQYFTEAKMSKLKNIGYDKPFHTLEEGIKDYVGKYLKKNLYY